MPTTQTTGRTDSCTHPQWFFEADPITGDKLVPTWTDEELATLNATMTECLEKWQAITGHYWSSNFYTLTKYGNGALYTAHKPTWQNGGLSASTPEALCEEIRNSFR